MKALATIAGEFWELLDSDGRKAGGILVDGMPAQPAMLQGVAVWGRVSQKHVFF